MPKRCFLSAWVIVTLLLWGGAALAQGDSSESRIVIKNPMIANPSMPKVVFNHAAHEAYVDANHGDCSTCHKMTSKGLSTALLNVGLQKESKKVAYVHTTCTACHKASGKGPLLVECRTCHTSATQAMK